jgi:uncharacterized membrane protein
MTNGDKPSQNQKEGSQQSSGGKEEQPNQSKKVEFSFEYAKSNKEKVITYILLVLGLLLLFFNNMLGGLLIGVVAGYFFDSEIIYYIRNLNQIISGQEHIRYVVLTALVLGLLIAAPGIFIGAVIIAIFKQVLFGKAS